MSEDRYKKILISSAAGIFVLMALVVAVFWDFFLGRVNDRFIPRPTSAELSSDYAHSFKSTLPVLYIRCDDFDAITNPPEDIYPRRGESNAAMIVFNDDSNTLFDEPSELYPKIRIKIRGRSSASQQKRPYAIEFQKESGEPIDMPFLSFDPESDFVLHAPYIDKSCLRNYIAYTLAGELMDNAPHCELVEVFVTDGKTPIEEANYLGVYLAVEKIKPNGQIVDITEFNDEPSDDENLEIRGGYIFRRDKFDEGTDDVTVLPVTGRLVEYQVKFPVPADLSEDNKYKIFRELVFLEDIVYKHDYELMKKYIDIDSFIYAIMINEFSLNTEAFEGSAYFYRPVDGKLTAGPVWDFDMAFGNSVYLPATGGLGFQEKRLELGYMENEEFIRDFASKWRELREPGMTFSDEHLIYVFDSAVADIGEGFERNSSRYPELFDGTSKILGNYMFFTSYQEELDFLRAYLLERAAWMDEYFSQY